jgi:hypothetical protein
LLASRERRVRWEIIEEECLLARIEISTANPLRMGRPPGSRPTPPTPTESSNVSGGGLLPDPEHSRLRF